MYNNNNKINSLILKICIAIIIKLIWPLSSPQTFFHKNDTLPITFNDTIFLFYAK